MKSNTPALTTIIIGVLVVVALVWVGLSRRTVEPPPTLVEPVDIGIPLGSDPVKVGWIGPLSGEHAIAGASIKLGVELAHRQVNANVELIFEDSKCTAEGAVSAINKLINTDQVQVIIGDVCSVATFAAAAIATQNQLPILSAATASPELSELSDFVFRVIPSDTLHAEFAAQLIADKEFTELAILYSDDQDSRVFNDILTDKFTASGGEVVASESFEPASIDLSTQLAAISQAAPDAIYIISNSADSAIAALEEISEQKITAAIFGSSGFKNPAVLEGAGDTTEGLIFTSISSGTTDFANQHLAEMGEGPGPFAAQGFDAYIAVTRAIGTGATDGIGIRDALRHVTFAGASGDIKFDSNGDITGRFDVFEVVDGQFTLSN